jgi:PAS domain S-box-containing protein
MVVELIRNVTDKRDMEMDLDKTIDKLQAEILQRMKAEEALRRSERLYRMIAETAHAGIWQLDLDGRVQFLNPTMKRLLQIESELELEGRTCFDFVPSKSVKPIELSERPDAAGRAAINSYEAELIGAKGERREVLVSSIVTFPADSPKPETYIEIFMDITEMRRSEKEAELRRMKLMQAEKMASLGVLVSGVAHEINNPNNFIMLNAPILLDVWKSSLPAIERHAAENPGFSLAGIPYDEMKALVPQLFKSIFDGAERIKGIVAGLKDYARQEIPEPNASRDVNEAVKTSLVLLSNMIKKAPEGSAYPTAGTSPRAWQQAEDRAGGAEPCPELLSGAPQPGRGHRGVNLLRVWQGEDIRQGRRARHPQGEPPFHNRPLLHDEARLRRHWAGPLHLHRDRQRDGRRASLRVGGWQRHMRQRIPSSGAIFR